MGTEVEVQEAWSTFFRSLTPDQKSLLSQASTASSATTPESTSAINSPNLTEEYLAFSNMSTDVQQGTRAANRGRRGGLKKRPLNAFMAFRSYYSPQLSGMTQKVKSRLMQCLWAGEMRKNLWALLAKAYTDLRDNHQELVSLDKFLMATVTEVPVIPAPVYLAKMGWELTRDDKGEKMLRRATWFDVNALNAEYPLQTNLSVLDIVNHCYELHVVHRSTRIGRTAAVTFTTTSTMPAAMRDDRNFDFDMELREIPSTDTERTEIEPTNNMPVNNAQTMVPSPAANFNNIDIEALANYGPSANDVTVDQQYAFAQVPFAMHFHPQVQPQVLGFDPSMIQDDFDPFALDDGIDEELEALIAKLTE